MKLLISLQYITVLHLKCPKVVAGGFIEELTNHEPKMVPALKMLVLRPVPLVDTIGFQKLKRTRAGLIIRYDYEGVPGYR